MRRINGKLTSGVETIHIHSFSNNACSLAKSHAKAFLSEICLGHVTRKQGISGNPVFGISDLDLLIYYRTPLLRRF